MRTVFDLTREELLELAKILLLEDDLEIEIYITNPLSKSFRVITKMDTVYIDIEPDLDVTICGSDRDNIHIFNLAKYIDSIREMLNKPNGEAKC